MWGKFAQTFFSSKNTRQKENQNCLTSAPPVTGVGKRNGEGGGDGRDTVCRERVGRGGGGRERKWGGGG